MSREKKNWKKGISLMLHPTWLKFFLGGNNFHQVVMKKKLDFFGG